MHDVPPTPPIEDAPPALLESGHLWLQEAVDGCPVRFQLAETGAILVGDDERLFEVEEAPLHYRRAVRHLEMTLDRDALREAVPAVTAITFYGVATCRRRIVYDWNRLPPVLGTDVWSATEESFLPPDTVEQVFQRLGLDPLPAIAKEIRAVDFDPESYEIPDSEWADEPAAGVVVRNKRGGRALIERTEPPLGDDGGRFERSATELLDEQLTPALLDRLAGDLEREGWPVTSETLYERALEAAARRLGPAPFEDGVVEPAALREAVAGRTSRYLADAD